MSERSSSTLSPKEPTKNLANSSPEQVERARFLKIVEKYVSTFTETKVIKKIFENKLTIDDYHRMLLNIFHQSRRGPLTFALAGTRVDLKHWGIQSYLLHHAEEEKSHWEWTINDLTKTNYSGEHPEKLYPTPATSAYVAFNYHIALNMPLARLGIALLLENLGANYGRRVAETLMKNLNLKSDQIVFIFGHGDTDVGHSEEILKILDQAALGVKDWQDLAYAAETAGHLYCEMYNE